MSTSKLAQLFDQTLCFDTRGCRWKQPRHGSTMTRDDDLLTTFDPFEQG